MIKSEYEKLFGQQAGPGRPSGVSRVAVRSAAGGAVTEQARRRAKRVLMERHRDEFEGLFALEIAYVEKVGIDGL